METRPRTWSECSWVMTMASRVAMSSPMAARRAAVSLRESPASTRTRVVFVPMKAQLPELLDASTQIFRIAAPLGCRGWGAPPGSLYYMGRRGRKSQLLSVIVQERLHRSPA